MSRSRFLFSGAVLATLASACSSDAPAPTGLTSLEQASRNQSQGRGVLQRYVAIGTSVSMGWQSDGVIAATQATSWPAQLAALGGRELEQPYIDGTGCRSPLVVPLVNMRRLSGEPLLADLATLSCSPLRSDVTLPVDNVAINGATTFDALSTTPESSPDPLYDRVLEPGHTQVSTMLEANPKLVSVELGANEVLGARSGIAIPGVSMVPFQVWQPLYDQVLDRIEAVTKMAVLAGLPTDIRNFPAFRSGNELWVARLEFAQLGIAVNADCNGSPNQIFVPVLLAQIIAARAPSLSCTASLNPAAPDLILTPTEVAIVNAQIQAMNAYIQAEAAARGFAYFSLGALYDRSDLKPPFSLNALLFSPAPFGALMSLDGVHPNAAGARVLAIAAAHALNATYKLGIPE